MRYIVVTLAIALLAVPLAWGKTLQSAYDEAGSGEGYDKLLVLDPNIVYTGGLGVLQGKKSCIRGNGALIDLERNQIYCSQAGTEVHITGCCFVNGSANDAAIAIQDGATGVIDSNTICKGLDGIKVWIDSSATIKNNIIYGNSRYGVACYQTSYPSANISYNDVDTNYAGNYAYYCPG
ncbi:MAG: right-handed parallel beta-helix repeat-containing protein [Candidatus Zixiibacteriota bacterium]